MCSGFEAGSYLRLIDSCINQLKAQGPSRICNESKEEEKVWGGAPSTASAPSKVACFTVLGVRLSGKGLGFAEM